MSDSSASPAKPRPARQRRASRHHETANAWKRGAGNLHASGFHDPVYARGVVGGVPLALLGVRREGERRGEKALSPLRPPQ